MDAIRAQCRDQGRRGRLLVVLLCYGVGVAAAVAVGVYRRSFAVIPLVLSGAIMMGYVVWRWRLAPRPIVPVEADATRFRWPNPARNIAGVALLAGACLEQQAMDRSSIGVVNALLGWSIVAASFGIGWLALRLHGRWRARRNARLELELERRFGLIE